MSRIYTSIETGEIGGKWGVTANAYRVSFGGEENVLELNIGDGCTTL